MTGEVAAMSTVTAALPTLSFMSCRIVWATSSTMPCAAASSNPLLVTLTL
jgi:hypothetical protein